jgi:hypothetical protein
MDRFDVSGHFYCKWTISMQVDIFNVGGQIQSKWTNLM